MQRQSRYYAVAQIVIIALFAAIAIFVPGPQLFTSPSVKALGYALCAGGIVLMAFGFSALRGVVQIAPEPRADGRLITGGIYAWLRHPIYTAILAIAVGLVLRRPTALLAIGATILIVFLLAKTRYEEARLTARYPEYSEYRKRTWGPVPGFRS